MKVNAKDRSKYFRGLLILIRKDHKVSQEEKKLMLDFGKHLGFEKKFCETAIHEILENTYIDEDPPKFSDTHFAESFILDAIRLAISDNDLNPDELSFLKKTLHRNNLSEEWFSDKLELYINGNNNLESLEIEKYL